MRGDAVADIVYLRIGILLILEDHCNVPGSLFRLTAEQRNDGCIHDPSCLILEFEYADKAGELEDVLDVVARAAHDHLAACGLGTFQNAEQNTQAA